LNIQAPKILNVHQLTLELTIGNEYKLQVYLIAIVKLLLLMKINYYSHLSNDIVKHCHL